MQPVNIKDTGGFRSQSKNSLLDGSCGASVNYFAATLRYNFPPTAPLLPLGHGTAHYYGGIWAHAN
jgi:hypothetical protein